VVYYPKVIVVDVIEIPMSFVPIIEVIDERRRVTLSSSSTPCDHCPEAPLGMTEELIVRTGKLNLML